MNGSVLLDTNIVIAIMNLQIAIDRHLGRGQRWYISSIVLGELYYGAFHSTRIAENLARVEAWHSEETLLVCDAGTAREYGQIRKKLRSKGRPTPENDIWIAATARQYDLTLITRDQHFREVDSLAVEVW